MEKYNIALIAAVAAQTVFAGSDARTEVKDGTTFRLDTVPKELNAVGGAGFHNYGMVLGVPPFREETEAFSRDARELFRDGIIDSVALCCPIVPRGDPPENKADAFAEMFRTLRKHLEGSGIPTGILLYATMGHGGSVTMPSPFQKMILGRRNGMRSPFFCPEDEKFCEYIGQNIRKLGQEMPDFFIMDDDARLLTLREGCFCPLHVDHFNRLHSTKYSAEELRKLVYQDTAFAHQYDELLQQTMENYFRGIRKAIDDVSPDIHCGLFLCEQEARFYGKFAKLLAGKTGHPMVRVNNGRYMSDAQRDVPAWLRKTAGQMVLFGDQFHILSETDTCPHNRYSMSAYSLLQHIMLSYLEGCKGGSLWITGVQNLEPTSAQVYRRVLRKHSKQLQALRKMDVAWSGAGTPVSTDGYFDFPDKKAQGNSWEFIFGRMGIPFTFVSDGATCNALTARQIQELSAKQLETIFRTSAVLVDGDAALALTEQGHADWLGCQAAEEAPPASFEVWNGKQIRGGGHARRHLQPLPKENAFQPTVFEQLSAFVMSSPESDQPPQAVAPAALHAVNCFGQHVITMARSARFDGSFQDFVMLTEKRKEQLIDFLNRLAPLGLYYTEDAELLLRYGFQGKQRVAYLVNLGFDPLDTIPLRGEWTGNFAEVQMLDLDGQWKTVPATKDADGTLQLQLPVAAHQVVILQFL